MNFTLGDKLFGFIWINGKFVPEKEATIHALTHSLHYGGAVYEGERAYNGRIFKLEEHTKRLLKSAEYMGLAVECGEEEINRITYEVLEKNSLQNAYIRPLIWRGSESIKIYHQALSVNLLIAALPSSPVFTCGLKLNVSQWRKPPPDCLPAQAKSSAHYAMGIVAQIKAEARGYDDSLVLDYEGFVAECIVSNIFFGKGKKLITPIADRFLNGITRQAVILMAKSIGFEVTEARMTLEELENYDYCFLTGTAREICGVGAIDLGESSLDFPDPEGKVALLQAEFTKLVGK